MSGTDAVAVVFAGGAGCPDEGGRAGQAVPPGGRATDPVAHARAVPTPPRGGGDLRRLSPARIDEAWTLVHDWGIDKARRIVPGGASAQESIFNGLRSAVEDGVPDDAVVLVHDGVRPLINRHVISRNIDSARRHGNAITAIPCSETIGRSADSDRTIASVTRRDEMYVL